MQMNYDWEKTLSEEPIRLFREGDMERAASVALRFLARSQGVEDIELKTDVEIQFELSEKPGWMEYLEYRQKHAEWFAQGMEQQEWQIRNGKDAEYPPVLMAKFMKAKEERNASREAFKKFLK